MIPVRNDVKRKNQIEVLNYLRVYGARPRIDIAAYIKLTKAAVTSLTNEMIAEGMLQERGEIQSESQRHQRGRRRIMLDVNENYRLAFGIVVGRNTLQVGLTNLKGDALGHADISIDDCGYRGMLEKTVALVEGFTRDNCISTDQLLGAGICLSPGGEFRVDGATIDEKLARIKKDLSHALTNLRLMAIPTSVGALVAQKLFVDRMEDNILMLRYGLDSCCAVMTNGQTYRGNSRRAGGFDALMQNFLPQGFAALLEEPGTLDGSNQRLNEILAYAVALCATVLDPGKIAVFGSYFETDLAISNVNLILDSRHAGRCRVEPAFVTRPTLFLAGCAAAIASFFYMREF